MTNRFNTSYQVWSTVATPKIVEADAPDAVIVASGSSHIIPDIPGVKKNNVITAVDVHVHGVKIGNRIVVIGGNLAGCETALYLQRLGKEVTIVEMTGRLYADASHLIGESLQYHLKDAGISCITGAECTEISDQGVHIKYRDGKTGVIPADSIVLAAGMQSTMETVESMLDCATDVIPVGDCIKPGTVQQASRTGYYAAQDI